MLRPRKDYLTIQMEPVAARETASGLYIAGVKDTPDILTGTVIAVGPDVDDIKPKQRVGVPSHCCHAVVSKDKGSELIVVREEQVEFEVYGDAHVDGVLGGEGEW